MEKWIVLKKGIKRQKMTLISIFFLSFLVALSFSSAVSLTNNANNYIHSEMIRLGFGDITAWINGDENEIIQELESLDDIEYVMNQPLIYANYEINEEESDSEGQLIVYDFNKYPYRLLDQNFQIINDEVKIQNGEIMISPSLQSTFDIAIGDTITFPVARNGVNKIFTVKGFYEDPFMGSSMIGMKGFLINEADYREIVSLATDSGIDGLARAGSMLHIFKEKTSTLNSAQLNQLIHNSSLLSTHLEFVHSNEAISQYMLVLQNAFSGFLFAFVLILGIVILIVVGHSITTSIEQESSDLAILKTMGFTYAKLREIQLMQFLIPVILSWIIAVPLAILCNEFMSQMMVSTTGIIIPSNLSLEIIFVGFIIYSFLLVLFIVFKSKVISSISPLILIRTKNRITSIKRRIPLHKNGLNLWMALRQLSTGVKRYASICLISILLVFVSSSVLRMNDWLGTNGEGMMRAFNPADHDIGIQPLGDISEEEILSIVNQFSNVNDSYLLAMPNVQVEGIDMDANVITEPDRFQILQGRTIENDNEVVITETIASEMNKKIGDTIEVGQVTSQLFDVVGIYQCANDMGENIGLSRDGYLQIGEESNRLWCFHYFLEDTTANNQIIHALENAFGGDIHIHENTWPGLFGIINAMRLLIFVIGITIAIFVLVVTYLNASKLLWFEQKDLGIYKAIGFRDKQLRISFAIRFVCISFVGAVVGTVLSILLSDSIIAFVMSHLGISSFSARPDMFVILLPLLYIVLLFGLCAYSSARKIKKIEVRQLVSE